MEETEFFVCYDNTRGLHFQLFYKFLEKMCNIQHFFTFEKVVDFQKIMGKCAYVSYGQIFSIFRIGKKQQFLGKSVKNVTVYYQKIM